MYEKADGNTPKEKTNSIRRKLEADKREAAKREEERLKQPVITDTPKRVDNPTYGHRDVTNEWLRKAIPNSHPVTDIETFVQDGATYVVDGKNVKFEYSEYEKGIAGLISRKLGGEIRMMPKVNYPFNVSTPDYIFRGERYDLKQMHKSTSKHAVYNRIHDSLLKGQADHFVLEITGNPLGFSEISRQVEEAFTSYNLRGVKSVVIIEDGIIKRVIERK